MAALGTNMGKKSENASKENKPKKKVSAVKAKPAKKLAVKAAPKKAKKPVVKATKSKPVKSVVKEKVVAKTTSKAKPKKAVAKAQKPVPGVEANAPKTAVPKKAKTESAPKKEQPQIELRNAKLILEPSKRKKIRKTKVILEGDLSINNVDAFMSQIEPIFNDFDYVDFFQREVTAIDLCHIQMLYYFQNHPTRKGKTVTVNSELSADLKKVVTNAGFKEFMFIPKLV